MSKKHPKLVTNQAYKYMHIRAYDYYTDNLSPVGGVTVAYRFPPDTKEIHVGVAICSSKDNYCKAIGRQIASHRPDFIFEVNNTAEGRSSFLAKLRDFFVNDEGYLDQGKLEQFKLYMKFPFDSVSSEYFK